jgi:hypothetical protein
MLLLTIEIKNVMFFIGDSGMGGMEEGVLAFPTPPSRQLLPF